MLSCAVLASTHRALSVALGKHALFCLNFKNCLQPISGTMLQGFREYSLSIWEGTLLAKATGERWLAPRIRKRQAPREVCVM